MIIVTTIFLWRLIIRLVKSILVGISQFITLEERLHTIPINFLFEIILHPPSHLIQLLIKITHPNHNQFIISTRSKVISFLIELNGLDITFMAEDSPSQSTFFQLPYFYFVVGWYASHVVT